MSVEDAAILSSLLGHCTSRKHIPLLLKVYDDTRVDRCCDIVAASREQGRLCDFEIEEIGDNLAMIEKELDNELRRWMWGYDPEEAFKEALKKFEANKAGNN